MELNRENIRKIRGLIIFTTVIVACLWKYDVVIRIISFVFHVFFPFILGGAVAFVLNVPMNFVERHIFSEEKMKTGGKRRRVREKLARPVSLMIVLTVVSDVIVLIMFVLVPQLIHTFSNLGDSLQRFLLNIQEWLGDANISSKNISDMIIGMELDGNKIMERVLEFFTTGAGNVLDSTITVAKNIVSGAATCFIAFAFAVYLLVQKETLRVQTKKVLYAFVRRGRADAIVEVLALTYHTFSGFLTGQCLEAVILGSMFVVSMLILRIPYALLIGILIAFTALVPVFGAFVGCTVGAFLIFVSDPMKALVFVVLFLVLQQIEGNLIYPHVVGNSVGLPSIWVLAAVSLGGNLMGIAGMLIFIPVVSVIYALFREIVYLKLKKAGINPEDISYF